MAQGIVPPRYKHGNTLLSFAVFVAALEAVRRCEPDTFSVLMNPLALDGRWFVGLWAVKCAGLALIDEVVGAWLRRAYADRKMPFRFNARAVGLERLEAIDYTFLAINSVVEFVFTAHVVALVLASERAGWRPAELGFANTVPALYLIFALDDAFYAPLHKAMHHHLFYPYVHKHHHRQTLPERGYLDAGNEHPIEQVLGLSCLYVTLMIVVRATGVHALTILVHFLLYAVLALLNHTDADVRFKFFRFEYSVRAHEMHHRYPNSNLAQYFMVWDKLMGTYRPYDDGAERARRRDAREAAEAGAKRD